MIYCKNCKYRRAFLCTHEKAIESVDVITGKAEYRFIYLMRSELKYCGPEAKLYKFEPSVVKRLYNAI